MVGRVWTQLRESTPWKAASDLSVLLWVKAALSGLGLAGAFGWLLHWVGAADRWALVGSASSAFVLVGGLLILLHEPARQPPSRVPRSSQPAPIASGDDPGRGAWKPPTRVECDGWATALSERVTDGGMAAIKLTVERPQGDEGKLTRCLVKRGDDSWSRSVWLNQPMPWGRDLDTWTVEFPGTFAGDLTQMDKRIPVGSYSYEFHASYGLITQTTTRTVARGSFASTRSLAGHEPPGVEALNPLCSEAAVLWKRFPPPDSPYFPDGLKPDLQDWQDRVVAALAPWPEYRRSFIADPARQPWPWANDRVVSPGDWEDYTAAQGRFDIFTEICNQLRANR